MRLTITRCFLLVAALSVLGLTACAPKSNPEPFPVNTSAPATSESVENESTDATKEADANAEKATTDETVATDAKATDAKATDAKATDAKATDAKATDAKATDAKATDAKATDAKATDAKATDAKATEEDKAEGALYQTAKEKAGVIVADDKSIPEKPKSDNKDIVSQVAPSATWAFTITDKGLQASNDKPVLVKSATFSVTNNTSDEYSFKLEGKKSSIETIAPKATGTCVCSDLGAGVLTVSAQKISKKDGVDFKPSFVSLNVTDPR